MELEKYRALVCAIESGSLTAAAEKLQYDKKGQGANTSLSYDKESAIATITVEGNDISVNPTNNNYLYLQF